MCTELPLAALMMASAATTGRKASFVIPFAVANTQGPTASTGTTATGASSTTSFHSQRARRKRAGGSNDASREPDILLPPQEQPNDLDGHVYIATVVDKNGDTHIFVASDLCRAEARHREAKAELTDLKAN
jgi:hypothetical protein